MELHGKTALVTGGTQGLGEVLCRKLAEAGVKVYVNCAHNVARAQQLAAELGGVALPFDIADENAVNAAFSRLEKLDILINNARQDPYKRSPELSDGQWFDQLIGVNLKGPYLCSIAAAKLMRRHGGGKIVNISSVWGYRAARPPMMEYAMSKAGLHSLSRSLALQLASDKITVNTVAPGMIDSLEMHSRLTEEQLAAMVKTIPMGRACSQTEIFHAVKFVLENDIVTGEIVNVNGGTQFV